MLKKLNEEIVIKMKNGEKNTVLALKGLKAELENNSKEKSPKDSIDVVQSYKNKLMKAKDAFAGNEDKIMELDYEISVVQRFLPEQMSENFVQSLINSAIKDLGCDSNIGAVMKIVSPLVKGRFEGKRLVELIQESLKK